MTTLETGLFLLAGSREVAALAAGFRQTGAAVIGPPALAPEHHASLLAEARAQLDGESWALVAKGKPSEISQDNRRGHLGPVARAYLSSPAVSGLMWLVTGREVEPSWSATCYTYYRGPGHYMGEHCDKAEACALGLLTYLDARWPRGAEPSAGLQLFVFRGDNSRTGLSVRITAHGNRCVILNGSQQAHLRPPLALGEELVMLAGCFRVVG